MRHTCAPFVFTNEDYVLGSCVYSADAPEISVAGSTSKGWRVYPGLVSGPPRSTFPSLFQRREGLPGETPRLHEVPPDAHQPSADHRLQRMLVRRLFLLNLLVLFFENIFVPRNTKGEVL